MREDNVSKVRRVPALPWDLGQHVYVDDAEYVYVGQNFDGDHLLARLRSA